MRAPLCLRSESFIVRRAERRALSTTLAAGLLAWGGAASANPKTDAQTQFEAGRDAAKRGDCGAAIEHFSRARALFPTAGSLYNIADCEERIGRLVSARGHWSELLSELPARDERIADAKGHVEALERRIPTVKIGLPVGAPAGTTIAIDDVTVTSDKLGVERPIDPGQHAVVVTAKGRARRSTIVVVAEGAREFAVQGELGAAEAQASSAPPILPTAPATPPATSAPPLAASESQSSPALSEPTARTSDGAPLNSGTSRSTLAYISGAAGIVGVAATVVSTVVLLGKKSAIADHCDATTKVCRDETGSDATTGIGGWSAIGTVGFGVGVLGIAGFFLLPRESSRETARDVHAAPRSFAMNPAIGPTFVGAHLSGSW